MTKRTRYFMSGAAAVVIAGVGTGLVAYYGGGFPSLSASRQGPSELNYVPADAAVIAYANVREVMDSELRRRLKQSLPNETGQQEFQSQTGIDIEHDIDYVIAAMTSATSSDVNGLVIARGRFNVTQLEALARDHGGVAEDYQGKHLLTVSDVKPADSPAPHRSGHALTLAFLEPGLVAIGGEPAIKSAIDAEMSAHSITSNADMMQLVSDIDHGNNAWAVGRLDAIDQSQIPAQIRSHIPPVKTFAVMAHIDGGVSGTIRADASDDQSGENLRQIVNGFLAFGRLQAQNDPKAALVMQSLQLSGSGKTVELSFVIPTAALDMLPIRRSVGVGGTSSK
ncbi:MAG: hypothetical protein ACRD1V_10500 [Vicinamibacterales bacterium]